MGLLSSLGLSFLIKGKYLLITLIGFLVLALFGLAFGAKKRHGYDPFVLGILASLSIVLGKFLLSSDIILYSGVVLLVAASVWNVLPIRIKKQIINNNDSKVDCQYCEPNKPPKGGY